MLKKMMKSVKGGVSLGEVLIDVALVTALIPVINTFINDADNLTTAEASILALVTLFIVLALVFSVGKQSGLIKGKR